MREFRNISGQTLFVDLGGSRSVEVEPDAVVQTSDDDERYWQTGETGEPAIWEVVVKKSSKTPAKNEE